MFLALGAASAAIDALKALTSSAKITGFSRSSTSPFDLSSSGPSASVGSASGSGGGHSQISPETLSALLEVQSQSSTGLASKSRSSALKDLFAQIDGDSDGKITKSEFEDALGAGGTNLAQADSAFGKLDKDGDGSVSLAELASALKGNGRHRDRDSDVDKDAGGSNSDAPSQARQSATSTSVRNSDGSVTTSLTYADGSKVTMTSAAGGSSSTAATSSYNSIEQMIQRQAQATSSSASLSVSA